MVLNILRDDGSLHKGSTKLWILSWKTRYQNMLDLQLREQWAQCPQLSTEAPNRQALHPRSCNEVAAVEQGWSIRSQGPAWCLQGVHPSSPVQTCEDGHVDSDSIPALLPAGCMTLESFWISLCFSLLVCTIGIRCVSGCYKLLTSMGAQNRWATLFLW